MTGFSNLGNESPSNELYGIVMRSAILMIRMAMRLLVQAVINTK